MVLYNPVITCTNITKIPWANETRMNVSKDTDIPDYNDNDMLCHCMSIKRSEVIPLVKESRNCSNNNSGDHNIDDLISCSGAGSVCMACHPLLEEILGKIVWMPVEITSIRKVSNDAQAYRLEIKEPANNHLFQPAKAGQHIIIQAYIDSVWEVRRYSLTTAADETSYREIIVQKEPAGKVSNWLHRVIEGKALIRISQPAGNVTPALKSTKPLVCLVGGVGITPAISFVRSIDRMCDNSRQIILDHSVLNEDRLILKAELEQLAEKNDKVHIRFRLTDKENFINQNDIDDLVVAYPDCDFYICGPEFYTKPVLGYLNNAGVGEESISIEHFSSTQEKEIKPSKSYLYLGSLLFVAFLTQELLHLKLPWLENLQTQETYKIYSGLFLVFYIFTQFIMSYNKSCETAHVSAKTYQRHKFRGALAPLVFFIHSTQFGTAYLFMLSLVYFSNVILGLFNHERIKSPILRIRYFRIWLPLHIILSVLSVTLIAFHIYVVASY